MADWKDTSTTDWSQQWSSWSDPNQVAHPNSPAGGSGPGSCRATLASSPFSPHPLPGSPADRSRLLPPPPPNPVNGSLIDRIKGAVTWAELKRWAEMALGPFSFDLGVCAGITEGVGEIGAGLFELLKMLVLSGLYERAKAAKWYDVMPVDLVARAADWAYDAELKKAHDRRVALVNQVREALRHPLDFFGQAFDHYVAEYRERWKRYEQLMTQRSLGSQFEAGRIVGGVLLDIVLLILTVIDGVGIAVKLAKTAPELLELAKALKGTEGVLKAARKVAHGAEAADAAVASKAEAVTEAKTGATTAPKPSSDPVRKGAEGAAQVDPAKPSGGGGDPGGQGPKPKSPGPGVPGGGPKFQTTPMKAAYNGENLPGNPIWAGSQVKYLTESERAAYKLEFRNGKIYDANGQLFDTGNAATAHSGDGRAIFVMDENGNFFASKHQAVGEFHHSSLAAGQPVAAAGELRVEQGVLQVISDKSGHYKPSSEFTRQALDSLNQNGIDTNKVVKDFVRR